MKQVLLSYIRFHFWLGFVGRRGSSLFICYGLSLIFTVLLSLNGKRGGGAQVNGEEPQIRPGLYSLNFLMFPALVPITQAVLLYKKFPPESW